MMSSICWYEPEWYPTLTVKTAMVARSREMLIQIRASPAGGIWACLRHKADQRIFRSICCQQCGRGLKGGDGDCWEHRSNRSHSGSKWSTRCKQGCWIQVIEWVSRESCVGWRIGQNMYIIFQHHAGLTSKNSQSNLLFYLMLLQHLRTGLDIPILEK